MTGEPAPTIDAMDGLTGALADIVCWLVFYLQRCEDEDVDLEVADELSRVLAGALRDLTVNDRLRFLEHGAARAATSTIADYQQFLVGLAETLGLE